MFVEREVRQRLNALSKEIFGVSSRWMRILEKGTTELVTRETTETVPGENGQPDTTKKVQVPVLTDHGAKQYRQKYYTVEEVESMLLNLKTARDEAIAKMKAAQELKNIEQNIQKEAGNN